MSERPSTYMTRGYRLMDSVDSGREAVWRTLSLVLSRSKAYVEIKPLGRVGRYNVVKVSFNAPYLDHEESEGILRKVAEGLRAINASVEYVDLSLGNIERVFLRGVETGLSDKDVIIAYYRHTVDPLIILVSIGREELLVKVLESIIRLIDKALEPIVELRRIVKDVVDKLSDIVDKVTSDTSELSDHIRRRVIHR